MEHCVTTTATPTWRFSIRSLLIVITVISVLLAPYHWFGFSYLFSLALSLTLIVWSTRSYRNKWQTTPIMLSGFGVISGCAGIGSIAFMLHSAVNLIGCIYCEFAKPQPRKFAIMISCLAVIPYICIIIFGIKDFQRISASRLLHPVESLEPRLKIVNQRHKTETSPRAVVAPLSSNIEANLTTFEKRAEYDRSYYRVSALSQLHNDSYRRFTAAAGFGPARMAGIPITIRSLDFIEYSRKPATLPLTLKERKSPSELNIASLVHKRTLEDFFRPSNFGYVQTASQVVGFVPHGPTQLDQELGVMETEDTASWQLTRLELVGLLKHHEPRVYISEKVPLMNELDWLSHRPVNDFEAKALPQLATEKDIVIEEFPGGANMLGAVRAGNDCLQCHNGSRGELLGAFSYKFHKFQ